MAYTISKTNGGTLVILNDGIVDTSVCSINLIGKNVSNFGDAQNENFVHLLENFAYSVEPRQPLQGQLWFDSSEKVFRPAVYDGTNWRPLAVCLYHSTTTDVLVNAGGSNFAASRPGDFWFDSVRKQLHVVTSGTNAATETVMIGPEGVPNFGTTKMSSVSMRDSGNALHPVIQMVLDGEVIGVLSKSSFTTDSSGVAIGFPKVNRGLTLKNYSSGTKQVSTSTDVALYGILDHLDSSFTRKNVNERITANWSLDSDIRLNFGSTNQSYITWSQTSGSLQIVSTGAVTLGNALNNLTFDGTSLTSATESNLGTSSKRFGVVYASTFSGGSATAYGSIEGNWNLTQGSNLSPVVDNDVNLGTPGRRFKTLYVKNIDTGGSGSAQILGTMFLTTGTTIAPVSDQASSLGSLLNRYSNVYTKGITAGTSADSLNVVGELSVDGNILPLSNGNTTLGSSSNKWKEIHSTSVNASSATITTVKSNIIESFSVASSSIASTNATIGNLTFSNLIDNFSNSISQFDKDVTLAANSHGNISTQKAVKTYVDVTKQYLIDLINQVQASLQGQLSNLQAIPSGSVFYVAMQDVPSGFLFCNGAAVSRTTYPSLFAALGYTYGGSGDTFRLPDLRGEFIRGWDAGRGVDPGRGFATFEGDSFRAHKHGITLGHEQGGSHDQNGFPQVDWTGPMVHHSADQPDASWCYPNGAGNPMSSTGGTETRPRNVALLPIIKI